MRSFIFYLPPYSPHLNLIETLWRKLKYETGDRVKRPAVGGNLWLRPKDYLAEDDLFYAVTQILGAVGNDLSINFADVGPV